LNFKAIKKQLTKIIHKNINSVFSDFAFLIFAFTLKENAKKNNNKKAY